MYYCYYLLAIRDLVNHGQLDPIDQMITLSRITKSCFRDVLCYFLKSDILGKSIHGFYDIMCTLF